MLAEVPSVRKGWVFVYRGRGIGPGQGGQGGAGLGGSQHCAGCRDEQGGRC